MSSVQYANPKQISRARLAANMSRADLAFAVRRVTDGQIKSTERGVRGWEKGEYRPSDGVIPAVAAATGQSIEFFYELDADDDEGDPELLRDLGQLPVDLRRRVERAIRRARAEARA